MGAQVQKTVGRSVSGFWDWEMGKTKWRFSSGTDDELRQIYWCIKQRDSSGREPVFLEQLVCNPMLIIVVESLNVLMLRWGEGCVKWRGPRTRLTNAPGHLFWMGSWFGFVESNWSKAHLSHICYCWPDLEHCWPGVIFYPEIKSDDKFKNFVAVVLSSGLHYLHISSIRNPIHWPSCRSWYWPCYANGRGGKESQIWSVAMKTVAPPD